MKISVSYLSSINDLERCIKLLDNTTCDYIHYDVMDHIFVPNETPSLSKIIHIFNKSQKKKDIHLMVKDVKKYIDEYKVLHPELITFHLEAVDNPMDIISYLKSLNIKIGIAIKPNTSIDDIKPYLGLIDLVLVMSVEPGFGGQKFMNNSIDKINKLNELRKDNHYSYLIEVDGGINDQNISKCGNVDIAVVGSFITKSDNFQEQINKILAKN